MIEITAADVIAGLTSLVEERGSDYVYKPWFKKHDHHRCTYVKDGAGDCGVGAYLINKGVPVERLAEFDTRSFAAPAIDVLEELNDEGVLTFDVGSPKILGVFQIYQDGQHSWGYSLEEAIKSL